MNITAQPIPAAQSKCLAYIRDYCASHVFGPTIREICQGIGLSSTNSVHRLVVALDRRGLIERLPYRHGTIRPVGKAPKPIPTTCTQGHPIDPAKWKRWHGNRCLSCYQAYNRGTKALPIKERVAHG